MRIKLKLNKRLNSCTCICCSLCDNQHLYELYTYTIVDNEALSTKIIVILHNFVNFKSLSFSRILLPFHLSGLQSAACSFTSPTFHSPISSSISHSSNSIDTSHFTVLHLNFCLFYFFSSFISSFIHGPQPSES
jgi:hypothetical protein